MLLDTNALFLPVRAGFPLTSEVDRLFPGARLAVAESSLREFDRLVERATPGAAAARALAHRLPRLPARAEGDEGVVEVAEREGAVVVTADRGLQERLVARGVAVLVPRDRHRLELRRPAVPERRGRAGRGNG